MQTKEASEMIKQRELAVVVKIRNNAAEYKNTKILYNCNFY